METAKPSNQRALLSKKTISKILRRASSAAGDDNPGRTKLRHSKSLEPPLPGGDLIEKKLRQQQQQQVQESAPCGGDGGVAEEEMEALFANLFAGVSVIKASYAQIQVAQSPYNPAVIQAADEVVVDRLRQLSQMKHAYLKKKQLPDTTRSELAARSEEHRGLLKTYRITCRKLEGDLERKGAELEKLEQQLAESDDRCRDLETENRSPASLRGLHLSGLKATHFLVVLRCAVKSARNFVKQLVQGAETAGWDLDAAAGTAVGLDGGVFFRGRKPEQRFFAFESFVCLAMFDGFQHRDFGLRGLEERRSWDQRQFFDEFSSESSLRRGHASPPERNPDFAIFTRAKYSRLVHPKMEAAFFGGNGNGNGFDNWPETAGSSSSSSSPFSAAYMEMAKCVWQLHCLFFSFDAAGAAAPAIFQVPRGSPFSEVYMESVASAEDDDEDNRVADAAAVAAPAVAFTVVPGFRIDATVLQSKVYLSNSLRVAGRR